MKKPLSWHRECLRNMRRCSEEKRLGVERAREEYERTLGECGSYEALIARAESLGMDGFDPDKFGKKVAKKTIAKKEMPDVGNGWRLLSEGEPLKPGDGYWCPNYDYWISFECRPSIFRGCPATGCPKKDYAHTWPWRRRIDGQQPTQ